MLFCVFVYLILNLIKMQISRMRYTYIIGSCLFYTILFGDKSEFEFLGDDFG